ncbi:MAG: magnesium/cobalt transporter CorA [Bdellovibrionales bacterium]
MAWFSDKLVDKLGLSPGTLIYTGDRPSGAPRVTLVQYDSETCDVKTAETWEPLLAQVKPGLKRWVHVEGLHDVRLIESIGRYFNIHQMSLEDLVNLHHRPKMSDFESYIHFVVKIVSPNHKKGTLDYEHGSVILGKDFVFSSSERRNDFLRPILDRFTNPKGRLRTFGVDYLAFALLDLVIDHFYLALSRLEEAVDQMETQILHRPSDILLGRLYEVKRETALVRKMGIPIRDFIKSLLKNTSPLVGEQYEIYYRDLEDHAIQIVDTCDNLKETLRNLLDVSDSYSSHSMNVMFKFFTVVSAVFLPLNFLASVYGMNFAEMPGLHNPSGFYTMTGTMLMIGLCVALFFRFKRWW